MGSTWFNHMFFEYQCEQSRNWGLTWRNVAVDTAGYRGWKHQDRFLVPRLVRKKAFCPPMEFGTWVSISYFFQKKIPGPHHHIIILDFCESPTSPKLVVDGMFFESWACHANGLLSFCLMVHAIKSHSPYDPKYHVKINMIFKICHGFSIRMVLNLTHGQTVANEEPQGLLCPWHGHSRCNAPKSFSWAIGLHWIEPIYILCIEKANLSYHKMNDQKCKIKFKSPITPFGH